MAYEKVISFGLVPTYDRAAKHRAGSDDESDVDVVPALLLLTQRQHPLEKSIYDRFVKIMRCPSSPLSDWALEIGALPDPRKATEVQPARNEVTVRRLSLSLSLLLLLFILSLIFFCYYFQYHCCCCCHA
jgi:hypothetical protein